MADIAGFPNFEIEFNKNGAGNDPTAVKQVLDFLAQGTRDGSIYHLSRVEQRHGRGARSLSSVFRACP